MHMSFEQIPPPEHPAIRAAREIKKLHTDNLAMMDSGHVFMKAGESVNEQMRLACMEQIALCDQIINKAETLDPKLLEPIELLLVDAKATIEKSIADATDSDLPEIGNYDHKNE